jgi:hypothetical protein
MAVPIRKTVQDFLSAVRSQGNVAQSSSPNSYSAQINPDGFSVQVSVTKAGVTSVLYSKIVYNMGCQSVGTQGDANQDSMTIFSADGAVATGSVTNFLSTLT